MLLLLHQVSGHQKQMLTGMKALLHYIDLQRETEEKARQPETKLSEIAQTRHIARLRDAKRSRTRNPKPTHGARDRPKQPGRQPQTRGHAQRPQQRRQLPGG
jgi:hypothetical protein